MIVKCKNCKESIFLNMSNKALTNKAIYCEHCNKVVFFTELPFAIVLSVIKWILFLFVYCYSLNILDCLIFLIFWSFIERVFMYVSYKYFCKE